LLAKQVKEKFNVNKTTKNNMYTGRYKNVKQILFEFKVERRIN